jgi:hypothetical protein
MAVLFGIQKLNRTTVSEYLESNGMNIDEMQVEDTNVIYHIYLVMNRMILL